MFIAASKFLNNARHHPLALRLKTCNPCTLFVWLHCFEYSDEYGGDTEEEGRGHYQQIAHEALTNFLRIHVTKAALPSLDLPSLDDKNSIAYLHKNTKTQLTRYAQSACSVHAATAASNEELGARLGVLCVPRIIDRIVNEGIGLAPKLMHR